MSTAPIRATPALLLVGAIGVIFAAWGNDARSPALGQTHAQGAVERCGTRSTGSFPDAYRDRDNLVVGPFVLRGAAGRVHYNREYGGQKFQAIVANGHRVRIALPKEARAGAGLAYGRLGPGRVTLRDTHDAVRMVACKRGRRSGSTAGGRRVTWWSGGVLVASRRCVPLQVSVEGRPSRTAVVRLGVRRCETLQ